MYKALFSAVLVLTGATMVGSIVLAESTDTDHGSGAVTNSSCLPDVWTALDLNEDGYANADEVAEVAPCIDFSAVDSNGDGHFSRVEFLNFQEAKAKGTNSDATAGTAQSANNACPPDQWIALDLNQDGYANPDEVDKAAPCVDFNAVDTNGDGHFSRVEFLNFQEGKSSTPSAGSKPEAGNANVEQKLAQKEKQPKTAKGSVDQSQYDTPLALVTNVAKGKLRNPFDPHDAAITAAGKHLFQTHGCSGCHGGDGGGGMCPPLTDAIWSYGDKPDTLYRLITLGTKKVLSEYGYTRNLMQTMQGAMPAVGPTFGNHPENVWKIITWIESMHLKK